MYYLPMAEVWPGPGKVVGLRLTPSYDLKEAKTKSLLLLSIRIFIIGPGWPRPLPRAGLRFQYTEALDQGA